MAGFDRDVLAAFRLEQQRRHLSPTTINTRRTTLTAFSLWLTVPIEKATPEHIEQWLDGCRLSARSRSTYLATLHSFYEWCVDTGRRRTDPTDRIRRPKLPRSVPRPLSPADLAMAFSFADTRMRSWLALGAFAGFRVQEIAGLQREDIIDADPPLIVVSHAKGSKERTLPLNPVLASSLSALPLPRAGYVFLNEWRRPFRPPTVSKMISEFLRGHGVNATAHQLRHFFGTQVYRSSRDLRLTQEMLGHSSPTTTAIYVQFDAVAAADVVRGLGVGPIAGGQPMLPL